MKVTSAQANKELKRLNDELKALLSQERQSSVFIAATTENVEAARPEYNFAETQEKITEIQEKIVVLKHAINLFNITHKPEGFDMTVDEMLVYIPQLNAAKSKYFGMSNRLEKVRQTSSFGSSRSLIEYEYANYNLNEAKKRFEEVSEQLTKAQLALDKLNTTETFEIAL